MSTTLSIFLAAFGGLLLLSVLLDDIAARLRLPSILLVLLLGLLVDNDIPRLPGSAPQLLSLHQAAQLSQVALVLVLFFGGLTSNWQDMRGVLRPAIRLATMGSLLTAALLMVVVLGLGSLPATATSPNLALALFVGAMMCSTDATAVMGLLRPLAGRLPQRLLDLLECESAFNDPVAVVLAGVALAIASGASSTSPSHLLIDVVREFLLGALLGFVGGSLAVQVLVLKRASLRSASLLAVVSLAMLLLLVGCTQLLGGSAILAAYLAGLVLGNSDKCDREALEEAHAGFAKMAELLLFLTLGLVVRADAVVTQVHWALVLFMVMQLVRWLMVETVLLRSAFTRPERLLITAAGLRGAVPIALAIEAAASDVPWGEGMPPLALGVVLMGLLLQGLLLVPLARRLGLASASE